MRPLGCQLLLNRVKEFSVHQRGLWPGIDCVLVANLADVKAVSGPWVKETPPLVRPSDNLRILERTSRLTLPSSKYRLKIVRACSASSSTIRSLPSLSS